MAISRCRLSFTKCFELFASNFAFLSPLLVVPYRFLSRIENEFAGVAVENAVRKSFDVNYSSLKTDDGWNSQ